MLLRFAVIAVGRILEGEEQIKSDDCFDSHDKQSTGMLSLLLEIFIK